MFFFKFVWDRGVAPKSFVFFSILENTSPPVEYWQKTILDDLPGGEGGTNEKIPNTEVQHPEKSKNRGEFWQKTLLGGEDICKNDLLTSLPKSF